MAEQNNASDEVTRILASDRFWAILMKLPEASSGKTSFLLSNSGHYDKICRWPRPFSNTLLKSTWCKSMNRIHITSCGPRSGTTLLTEMMISCFDIDLHTNHEDPLSLIPSRDAVVFLTKNPADMAIIKPVLHVVPNLYVICILRDPRDMIVSRHRLAPDKYWSGLALWMVCSKYLDQLESHPRFILIKYEDLVTRPDDVQDFLLARMPFLQKKFNFSSFDRHSSPSKDTLDALGRLRPVSAKSIGNWRSNLPRVLGQIRIHGSITQDLVKYGYESDASWEKELDDIEPDLSAAYWPEHYSKYRLLRKTITSYPLALWVLLGHYRPTCYLMRPIQTFYKRSRKCIRTITKSIRKNWG